MAKKIDQQAGDNSTNLQVGGNLTIGVTATEARQIAMDVFKINFYELSEKALKTATDRAIKITDDFIDKFYTNYPHLDLKLENPAVQASMFTAQKEFAKNGDPILEDNLLSTLLHRIDSEERSLKQIVLDEALSIIPKLTTSQINVLTFLFSGLYSMSHEILNLEQLKIFINSKFANFYPDEIISFSYFSHFQFTGCCTVLAGGGTFISLEEIFIKKYAGLFSNGFTNEEFETIFGENIKNYNSGMFLSCLRDNTKKQFSCLTEKILDHQISEHGCSNKASQLKSLFNKSTMSKDEVKTYLIQLDPKMANIIETWGTNDMKSMRLTSVGIAIAIINYNRVTGENIQLDGYI